MDACVRWREAKKLKAAARWILGARPDLEAVRTDLAAFGLAVQTSDLPPPVLGVWPENWQAARVFEAMQTQWRFKPNGMPAGLEYATLPTVMSLLGFNRRSYPELFGDIRIMEHEAMT